MRIYGLASMAGGGLLGVVAMAMSLLRVRGPRTMVLAVCMALSSVALFIGGTILHVASCCQAQAPKAEKPKTEKPKARKSK